MSLNFGQYTVETSNEDKLLFSNPEVSKIELIQYYIDMADLILPYTEDRPLTMHRFPDGLQGTNFYQKEASDYFPDWIDTQEVDKEEGKLQMVLLNKKASLAYLANQACIVPHIWLSKADKLHYPDKIVFDLDPPEDGFELVLQAAKDLRKLLEEELALKTFVMTTGSRGLHLTVPIRRIDSFDTVRDFAADISTFLASENNSKYTTEVRKDQRKGRLFIDYLRNSYAQTSVAPYAVRAIEGAPIATPLSWDELTDQLDPQQFKFHTIKKRVSQKKDPWSTYAQQNKSIRAAQERLKSL